MCWCFFAVFFLDVSSLIALWSEKMLDVISVFFFCLVFCPFTATPMAYGGSQARGLIGAVAAKLTPQPPDSSYICDLHHSCYNVRVELHLPPTTQVMAKPDP